MIDSIEQMVIRHPAQADLLALEWNGAYTHFRRLYQEIYESSLRGEAILWVLELPEAGVVGQLFVQLISSRKELADGSQRAYIYAFRIQPDYRGYGLGGRLLSAVEDDLCQRSFRIAVLNVARNNEAARLFYHRQGYQVVAAEPGQWSYLDNLGRRCWVDEPAWRMEKMLEDNGRIRDI
jgi:ribosomal protein S18 acetylase RimI-like enzyme